MNFVADINNPKKEEIQLLLNYVHKLMETNDLFIAPLWKNINFFIKYNIDTLESQYDIIRKLTVNNFCKCQIGTNPELSGEILYVFRTVEYLMDFTLYEEDVEIFIKFGKYKKQNDIIVVSFHDAERDLELFDWGN